MKKAVYIFLITLISVQVNAQQQSVQSFSLQQAVEYAKKNNYALKNNRLDVELAQKKVKETLAIGLPQINASANFLNNTEIATQVLPNFLKPTFVQLKLPGANELSDVIPAQFGQKFSAAGSITATQLLFDGGFLMGVKAAREYVALSEINVNRNNIETEVNVTKAYYAALLLSTNLNLIDKNLETLAKLKGDLEKTNAAGLIEKTDFDRVRLQYSTLELQRNKLMDQQRITMMILKFQMGLNVSDSVILTDELQKMYDKAANPIVDTKLDYNKRTEYQLVNQQIKLNTLDKKRYQFGYAPTISAIAQTQRNTFGSSFGDLGNTWYPGTYWGLNMSLPIFNGFRKSAQIQQTRINVAKAENDKINLENAINQQVLQAQLTFKRSGEQVRLQEENMALAQQIYERVQVKYANGVGSSFELTQSQNDLETARTNYLTTVYDYFVAQIELRKALGDIK
jgi:outer membrane protein